MAPGIDSMFVINADRVGKLEKAEAPRPPRAHPLQRLPEEKKDDLPDIDAKSKWLSGS